MKKTNYFILILLLASCTSKNSAIEKSRDNTNLIVQYFGYFNNHDWARMSLMYVETAEFKDPTLGNGIVKMTKEQILQKYTELGTIFPDVTDTVLQIYPSGENNIIVEFVSTGTAPDGSKFKLPICTIFTVENGKITKDFSYFDNFEE